MSGAGLHSSTQGTGSPVTLVHGWGMNLGVWTSVARTLSAQHRVICVDLPGHGESSWMDDDATLPGMAARIAGVSESPSVWLGWSLGALVSMEVALQNPRRVSALILVASTPRFVSAPDWPAAVDESVLEQFAVDLQMAPEETWQRFLTLQVRGSAAARATLRTLQTDLADGRIPSRQALQAGLALLRTSDLRQRLSALDMPVLFIYGQRDTLVPAAGAAAIQALLPRARCATIPGAGHAPFVSHPGEFLDLVSRFLESPMASGWNDRAALRAQER